MIKKTILFFLVLTIVLVSEVFATDQTIYNYDGNQFVLQVVKSAGLNLPCYYGEITKITSKKLIINCSDKDYCFSITPQTLFYCNGMISCWKALRPVTDDAFFEAEIYVDQNGAIRLVNGHYYGAECLIERNQVVGEQLYLTLYFLASNEQRTIAVNHNARIPKNDEWLEEEVVIFVLFSIDGTIRTIYNI